MKNYYPTVTVLLISFFCIEALATPIVVNINGIKSKTELGKKETKVISRKTGDHHCSKNCKGEPTRTPYRIDYSVSPSKFKIIDAKVECGGGTCGYSGNVVVRYTDTVAWATFDVWSRPTTWTLSVTVKPVNTVPGVVEQIDSDQVEEGKTFIVEHDPKKYFDIEIETVLPKLGSLRMSPTSPIEPYFHKIGHSIFGGINTYTIQYIGEK